MKYDENELTEDISRLESIRLKDVNVYETDSSSNIVTRYLVAGSRLETYNARPQIYMELKLNVMLA